MTPFTPLLVPFFLPFSYCTKQKLQQAKVMVGIFFKIPDLSVSQVFFFCRISRRYLFSFQYFFLEGQELASLGEW